MIGKPGRISPGILVLLVPLAASAADRLVGRARVIDGDTLAVAGVHVRLKGVAAPEVAHPGHPGEPGGEAAAAFMAELVEGRTLVCELTGERTHGRRVGRCFLEGRDVAGELIAAGLARDCPRYSQGRYVAVEPEAAHRLPLPDYCRPR
jgi:endonuclease YncB( thermonuclease family)